MVMLVIQYRVFTLADYGINYDYKVTNVAFGVESASSTFPVTVGIYSHTGVFPAGTSTLIGSTNVTVGTQNALGMVNTGTAFSPVIPAGSTFVLRVSHDGTTAVQQFYMGTNAGAQTEPSYISSNTCSILTPTATGTDDFFLKEIIS